MNSRVNRCICARALRSGNDFSATFKTTPTEHEAICVDDVEPLKLSLFRLHHRSRGLSLSPSIDQVNERQ